MTQSSRSIEVALCIVATLGATASLVQLTEGEVCPSAPAVAQPQTVTPIIRVEAQTPEVMSGVDSARDARANRRAARAELRALRAEMQQNKPVHCSSSGPAGEPILQKASLPAPEVTPNFKNNDYTTIERSTINALMKKDGPQSKIIPSFKNGVAQGFKIYRITNGSLLRMLGFKNGDTIVSVNGRELTGVDAAMASYQELAYGGPQVVRVEILRKGTPLTKFIEIR
ncbi:MAG: hypothetical protein ACPG4T_21265 [Nannocystaceae bacterium]